jgi:ABC-type amino acid transport system permease subunit
MTYAQCMSSRPARAFRNMLPVLLTQTIILFQDTSLVTRSAPTTCSRLRWQEANRPVETYLVAAVSTSSSVLALDAGAPAAEEDRHHSLTGNDP